jgi:hypothetical protein
MPILNQYGGVVVDTGSNPDVFPALPSPDGMDLGEFPIPQGFEPYLGLPSTDGYVLSSTKDGVRSWIAMVGGSGASLPLVGTYQADSIQLSTTGLQAAGGLIDLNNTGGAGIYALMIINSGVGSGIRIENSSGGNAINIWNKAASTAQALAITNEGSGDALYINNVGSAIAFQIGSQKTVFNPSVADSGGSIAYILDTLNNLVTTGAKLLSLRNQGTEKAYVDKDGNVYSQGNKLSTVKISSNLAIAMAIALG